MRRINTPIESEINPPRKLHNTQWGFICPAESPEGQSVGVVKNLSYMAHIKLHRHQSNIYIITEYIIPLKDMTPEELYGKVKVFINEIKWYSKNPKKCYDELKDKNIKALLIYIRVSYSITKQKQYLYVMTRED